MIGLLFNPLSGRIRKRKDAIRRVLAEIPGATCSEVTNEPEINASVEAFVRADVDLLVIIGGDGTDYPGWHHQHDGAGSGYLR